jgi:hypothetical protein
MAGFRMHVTTSALLGCGYAGVGHAAYGVPLDTAVVGGAMCGFAGMLPDLDSDYGVPLRETMAFTAAIVPMLLVARFQSLALSHDEMVLAAVSLYLFVRFGITNMIRKYTVHRGMFHSIPAALIFTGLAFVLTGAAPLEIRCFKAGGVLAGFLSHLILDEIYAVEWKGGQWRFKKSFGTALKFYGDDGWANFSTYAKLGIVAMIILGEPTVLERIEARHPEFAQQYQQLQNQLGAIEGLPSRQGALDAARTAIAPFSHPTASSGITGTVAHDSFSPYSAAPQQAPNAMPGFGAPGSGWPPPAIQQNNGTAQRPGSYPPQ